jgi:hypothetical protein
MEIRIGPPATGSNFYKRPALIAKLLRALHRGNVAFLGPRRTGKTSCLEEIHANPEGFLPVLINLEKHDTAEAWLADMLSELRKAVEQPTSPLAWAADKITSFLDRIRNIDLPKIGGIEIEKRKVQPAWRKPADEFLAVLSESDLPVLFLLDEFPTFLKLVAKKTSRDDVEAVLNWFRAARHALKDSPARFLVTGSIGLKGVVRGLGLAPTINEFDTHEIPPLAEEEALGLLEKLATDNKLALDLPGRRHILKLLGANWPILLQLFICEIQDCQYARSPTLGDLDQIYHERLVHGIRNQYCDGMYDRLKDIFVTGEHQLAREILKATCRTAGGLSRDDFETIHARLIPEPAHLTLVADELDYVLDTLKHDGYLLQQTTGKQLTCFGSNILRDFWLRKTA